MQADTLQQDGTRARQDRTAGGFTLIELLVVISIIALLIAILLPALNLAKESANIVVCSAKVHQVGLAFQLYANDFDQTFPISDFGSSGNSLAGNAHIWVFQSNEMLTPYVTTEEAYQCPSDKGQNPGYPWPPFPPRRPPMDEQVGSSYCYNTGPWHAPGEVIRIRMQVSIPLDFQSWGCWGRNTDNFEDTSKQVLVTEWAFYWLIYNEWGFGLGSPTSNWGDGRYFVFHGQLGPTEGSDVVSQNLAFVDGHTEFLRMRYRDGDPEDPHYFNEDYMFATEPIN